MSLLEKASSYEDTLTKYGSSPNTIQFGPKVLDEISLGGGTDFSLKKGGYFWNRIQFTPPQATLEEEAFARINGLMYRKKYEKELGVPAEEYKRRLQLEFGGHPRQYLFAQAVQPYKGSSLVEELYFQNLKFSWKSTASTSAGNRKRYTHLESLKLKPQNPINFVKYLCSRNIPQEQLAALDIPEDKKSIYGDSRLSEVIARTPFFESVDVFKSETTRDIFELKYERIAHIYYILSEYWSEVFYRANVLYNVELLTYYSELFDNFNVKGKTFLSTEAKDKLQKKLNRLNSIRSQLQKGDLGKKAQRESEINEHGSLGFELVDPETGLPLDSPLLHYRNNFALRGGKFKAPWPLNQILDKDSELTSLKTDEVAQILELLLVEPILNDQISPTIPNKTDPDVYFLNIYEPVSRENGQSGHNHYGVYLDDIRCKLLTALRETRKYMILNKYKSTANVEKVDDVIDNRRKGIPRGEEARTRVEDRAEVLFREYVVPCVNELNNKVTDNFKASVNHFEDKKTTADRYSSPSELMLTGYDLMKPYISSPSFSTPSQSYSLLQNYSSPLSSRRVP